MPTLKNLNNTTPAAPSGRRNAIWQLVSSPSGTDPVSGYPFYDASVNFSDPIRTVAITVDGAGIVPGTGSKGFAQIPFAGTITNWTILSDLTGSATFDVKKSTFAAFPTTTSIVASAPPTLSSNQKATSSALSAWTTTINAGDVIEFVLSTVSTLTRVILELTIEQA